MATPTFPEASGPTPNLAEVARLAEQFFSEQFGAQGPQLVAAPSVAASSVVALPSPTAPDAVGAVSTPSAPAVPSTIEPSYYFIADAPTYQAPVRGVPHVGTYSVPNAGPTPDDHRTAQSSSSFEPEPSPLAYEEPAAVRAPFDVHAVRNDFPILSERVNGRPLVWLDNAATTHKPKAVIDRISYFYEHENSNIHRAAHELAARATDAYEGARSAIARFVGAPSSDNIVYVRGATEAINLVAAAWGRRHIGAGDEIIVSHLEHHANIVPWQLLTDEVGAKLRVIPVDDDGQILVDAYVSLLNERTKLVSITQVSNALGTVVPVAEVAAIAHSAGAKVLIDGAQAVSHLPVDVRALGADFYVFSGHKVFGPTGIGALYGTTEVLEEMGPYQGGGNMIEDVTFEQTRFHGPPHRFEAGTGNIADAVGLGAAIEYVERLGLASIAQYEHDLTHYALDGLRTVPGLTLVGTAPDKTSVLSFVLAGFETTEVGEALNREGIAVRSGHHCAQPILRRFGHEATVRPSLALYNTAAEVDCLVDALHRLVRGGRRSW